MTEYKCKNGDKIYVDGVYVKNGYTLSVKIIAPTMRYDVIAYRYNCGSQAYMHKEIESELPRDGDGYYIWDGGAQPVPDDWFVEVKLDKHGLSRSSASNYGWAISDSDDARNTTAFRVVSTSEVKQPEQEDWCKVGAKVCIGSNPKVHEILKIDEDKGCFLGCGLWKCRTELEPYNVSESDQAPEGATVGEPALTGWQDPSIVDLEITLTKELFISLAMDAHLCNISLNEHLVNIIEGEYK